MSESPQAWIGTSWKMTKTLHAAMAFAESVRRVARDPRIQRFVIPPFTAVREVKAALAETDFKVGAQNMHWAESGAWTGEISAGMLTDCGLDMVELGHSERRAHFGETNETVGLKTEAAVKHGLIPLVCIGETAEDKEAGRADTVLKAQIEAALGRLDDEQKAKPVLLAYEPVWAIGEHGTPASPDYADERHALIIEVAETVMGRPLPCLYGGGVNLENCSELITQKHIDGLFIGRSAWTAEGYLAILERCARII
ncbi:triose-phosphate isomerase [Chelativorans sp. YIM 93263]|uniref:triose-phosphate isomerase n=1 Tax=Chelativorans sp. YIM 93263 TaxID=2906648 RepID=UPI0023787882|nr:triose-phosphate isomerase [Chelativorans sp. YIM 93263]